MLKKNILLIILFSYIHINKTMQKEEYNSEYDRFNDAVINLLHAKDDLLPMEHALKSKIIFELSLFNLIDAFNKNKIDLVEKIEAIKLIDQMIRISEMGVISIEKISDADLMYNIFLYLFKMNILVESLLLFFQSTKYIEIIKKIIIFLNINEYINLKNIIFIGLLPYILWIIMEHYKSIKNLKNQSKDDIEKMKNSAEEMKKLKDEVEKINKEQKSFHDKIQLMNSLIGVKLTKLIIEIYGVFIKQGEYIGLLDAICETDSYKKSQSEKDLYNFYELISSNLLTNNDDKITKETIQKCFNIREYISSTYKSGDKFPETETLFSPRVIGIIQLISKSIQDNFLASSEKKTNQNYFFYGPAGTGKTQIAKNIIQEIIKNNKINEAEGVVVFEINNSDIQNSNDIKSLQTQVNILLNEKKKVIVFIDEADGIFKDRKFLLLNDKDTYDIIPQMLQFINDFSKKNLTIIMNSNYKDKLDDALIRDGRFNKYSILLPNADDRCYIALAAFTKKPPLCKKLLDQSHLPVKELLQKDKNNIINILAAYVSVFTVNNTPISVLKQSEDFFKNIHELYMNHGGQLEKKIIINTMTSFFEKIYQQDEKNNKVQEGSIKKFIDHIENNKEIKKSSFDSILKASKYLEKDFNDIVKTETISKNYQFYCDPEKALKFFKEEI